MKMKILAAVAATLIAAPVLAGSPVYVTKDASGTSAATAYFPAITGTQLRVVGYSATSDKSASVMSFSTGTTAYNIVATNVATTSVTNQINSTNGLAPNDILVLQHDGTCYSGTVSTFNATTNAGPYGGTNVVLTAGGWGVATSVGDSVYLMSTATTIPVGATTTVQNGEAIYVGNYGRPVKVTLDGTSSCAINAVSGHYD